MTLGRPAIVSKTLAAIVPLPAIIDDEFLSDEPGVYRSQPNASPSILGFFIKSLQLYDIVNDILLLLYFGEDNDAQKDPAILLSNQSINVATVMQLDRDLMKWGRSLPPYLRISSLDSFSNTIFLRQAIIGRIREAVVFRI